MVWQWLAAQAKTRPPNNPLGPTQVQKLPPEPILQRRPRLKRKQRRLKKRQRRKKKKKRKRRRKP